MTTLSLVYLGERFEAVQGVRFGAFIDQVTHFPQKWPLTWAEVQSAAERGLHLNIRPATVEELVEADSMLAGLMEQLAQGGAAV